MFTDLFSYDPPQLDDITAAVESYQRVACARFFLHMRRSDPRQQPLEVTGDTLVPTPRQLHSEVRALRHLTAIQRTLRDSGGALFNPESPLSPRERLRIVNRRLDAIEEALGDSESGFESDFESAPSVAENSSSSPDASFYNPPEIEDLLEAVDYAQKVFVARAELLDKRRLQLSCEDFALEILALRDLTAVIRTLRRMSAKPLQEDEPLPESRHPEGPGVQVGPGEVCDEARPAPLGAPSANSASLSSSEVSNPVHPVNHVENISSPSIGVHPRPSAVKGEVSSLHADRPVRPVPRVPEVRPLSPRRTPECVSGRASSETPICQSASSSESSSIPEFESAESVAKDSIPPLRPGQTLSLQTPPVLADGVPPPSNSP